MAKNRTLVDVIEDSIIVQHEPSQEAREAFEEVIETPIPEAPKIRLNLGCGFRKEGETWINIDIRPEVNPDVIADIEKGLSYADSSVDEIRAHDVLEHINPDKVIFVMSEIHRVLKSDGVLHFFIPSTDGRGAFQDPSHRSFWNINSWLYYVNSDWHALYPTYPFFRVVETIHDVCLNEQLRIIHTEGKVQPVK